MQNIVEKLRVQQPISVPNRYGRIGDGAAAEISMQAAALVNPATLDRLKIGRIAA
jgi:hypothetical protein